MSETRPVAFVTGASRGIGRGIAVSLAQAGFDIAGAATTAEKLDAVGAEVAALQGRFAPVAGDVSDLGQHERMVNDALELGGRIDCFVSNAGIAPSVRADLLDMTPESFDHVLNANLRGSFFLAQRVARSMVNTREAGVHRSIIFITSVSARAASANRMEYCISKAGLSMAAKGFAVGLAPHGINVYEVQPGIVETDMTAGVREKYDARIGEGLLLTPRWGTPEDIGRACASLATGVFAYATGAVIEIGGGFGVPRL